MYKHRNTSTIITIDVKFNKQQQKKGAAGEFRNELVSISEL